MMHLRHDGWADLVNDEDCGGRLIPMMMLCHEHDEDPELRHKPIRAGLREEAIAFMAAGVVGAFRYFRARRETCRSSPASEPLRGTHKVGRNDLCPCGSEKKYKKCCGSATVN